MILTTIDECIASARRIGKSPFCNELNTDYLAQLDSVGLLLLLCLQPHLSVPSGRGPKISTGFAICFQH